MALARTHNARASPVSASNPVGTSTANTGARDALISAIQPAIWPSISRGGEVEELPIPSSASMQKSNSSRGASTKVTPASRARWYDIAASGGALSSLEQSVTTGDLPQSFKCIAASRPSPPLLPGPQAIQNVLAFGASARASLAVERPARCISAWGVSMACAACSIWRVMAVSYSGRAAACCAARLPLMSCGEVVR